MVTVQIKSNFDPNWVPMNTQNVKLNDLLFELANTMPDIWTYDREQAEFSLNYGVFINGQAYTDLADGLDTILKNDDKIELSIIPMEGG